MTTDLLLPRGLAPTNVKFRGEPPRYVTNDVYAIGERMRELDPNLYAVEDDEGYHIMQSCPDGVERLALANPVKVLDARVIERLRYILAVPFADRVNALERDEAKHTADSADEELERMYERMGGQMRHDLANCGFTGPIPTSTAKRNKTARRSRNYRGSD